MIFWKDVLYFKKKVRRLIAKHQFYRQISRMLDGDIRIVPEGPAQSAEIALATSAMYEKDVEASSNPDNYFLTGYSQTIFFLKALEKNHFDLRKVNTILDFGCGSARHIRFFRGIPGVRLIGIDKNWVCIEWCKKNIPGIEFYRNADSPPLDFLEMDSVDLIIAQSVFTHISLDIQKIWLKEMYRILRPGGIFLCTVLGKPDINLMLNEEEKNILTHQGQISLNPDHERISLSSRHTGQQDVFQTRSTILTTFGENFIVRDWIEAWQDLLVLQK